MIDVPDQFAFVIGVIAGGRFAIAGKIVCRHFLRELFEDLLVDDDFGKLVFALGHLAAADIV